MAQKPAKSALFNAYRAERVDNGESYRSIAAELLNFDRVTLMDIYKDDDRRAWYLGAEADDERVHQLLTPEPVQTQSECT